MKIAAVSLGIVLFFSSTAGYAEERCRSWRVNSSSHLLFFRDMEAVRIEFPQREKPHKSVRIHLGRCDHQRYIEVVASASFWSDLSEKAIGFAEVCTQDVPCSSQQKAFLEILYTLQKDVGVRSSQDFHAFVWENAPTAFGFFLCQTKRQDIFLKCEFLRPGQQRMLMDIVERKSLSSLNILNLSAGVIAIGQQGILQEVRSGFFEFRDFHQPQVNSFSFSANNVCESLPNLFSRYSPFFVSLLQTTKIRLISLLVLSRIAWYHELRFLSQPRLWLFRSPCQR